MIEESRLPFDEYTGESQLPSGEYIGQSCLPGGEYTGDSITNTNNFLKIQNKWNPFKACLTGQGEVVWWKNQCKKISWHWPYKIELVPSRIFQVSNRRAISPYL